MKKLILKTVFALFIVFSASKSFSQVIPPGGGGGLGGVPCPPGSCPPCWLVNINDTRPGGSCIISHWWRYPGSPNCGDVLAFNSSGNWFGGSQASCNRCDNGDIPGLCQCPSNLLMYVATIPGGPLVLVNTFNLTFPTCSPAYPCSSFQSFNYGPGCSFTIEYRQTGPNSFDIIITP